MTDRTPSTSESGEIVRRAEIESLMPGDVFEYQHTGSGRMVRDTVVQREATKWCEAYHLRTQTDFFKYPGKSATAVETARGENGHGYVILPAKAVVLVVTPSGPATL